MYISAEGLKKLKAELHELKTKKRQEIAERLESAMALGDLSENAEYQEAKEEQSLMESQIADIESAVRDAVLIQKAATSDLIAVGATVTVGNGDGEETYTIVGSEEADPAEGKISNESPIGRALIGRKVGNEVEIKTPGGIVSYAIRKIH